MSDVAPSFFPTPHEIAGGIRWVREHPVVATAAAAAATAVSIISYLKSKVEEQEEHLVDGDVKRQQPSRERFHTWGEDYRTEESGTSTRMDHSLVATRSKSHSDFQRCVAQKPSQKEIEEVCSNTESEVSSPAESRRHLSPRNLSFCELDSMKGSILENAPLSSTIIEEDEEGENNTGSPQWGWYVSTTPPEEYYS